jgi:hypothetical protein
MPFDHRLVGSKHRAAFLITKPLQLMVSLTIIDQLSIHENADILVVDTFHDAEKVVERFNATRSRWGSGLFFKDRRTAFSHASAQIYNSIYIDADVGLRKFVQLIGIKIKNPKVRIHVYEEGVGTYRTDLHRGSKKKLFSAVGVGWCFGGCRLTADIYVYSTSEYRSKLPLYADKALQIETPLAEFVANERAFLSAIFATSEVLTIPVASDRPRTCTLYLTNWEIDDSMIARLKSAPGTRYLKPHPHIKEEFIEHDDLTIIPNSIPAELLILELMNYFERIDILHHGTSAERYIKNEKTMFIRIGQENMETTRGAVSRKRKLAAWNGDIRDEHAGS